MASRLYLNARALILAVRLSNAFLRLRIRFLDFRVRRLLAARFHLLNDSMPMTPASMTPDPLPATQTIQVLFLHFDTEHLAPVRAQLFSVAPTFETLGHVLAGTVAPFDAGFMDVIGFSCAPAACTGSIPNSIYPCGSEVYRLGPVLFAGIADDITDNATMLDGGGAMHTLATLSALSFQELLDFYLPEMDTSDRLAATRAFGAGEQWNWGELYKVAI